MKYEQFIFESYEFDQISKVLNLRYAFDDALHFTETFHFDFAFADYDSVALDLAFQSLFFLAGISYFKMYVPSEIIIRNGAIDPDMAAFLSSTYEKGLGEFFYINNLNPRTAVNFPQNIVAVRAVRTNSTGILIGIGGGKDSLVSVELLRKSNLDIATWSLNHRPQLTPLIERIGLPHYWVEREIDPQIQELNEAGALNGHIPISAIFAAVGTVVGILSGRRDHVVSNEQSANEPTLEYDGVAINHQYSKSQEFEQSYQALLHGRFDDTQRYYSSLRPLSELRIAEIFSSIGFEKYHDVFSSCNRAFTHDSDHMFWDGKCAKCAFVFLALTPFIEQSKLETLFGGKNLLLDSSLQLTYRQLLGIEGDKPLECVGEVKESRAAMELAFRHYPDLRAAYEFDLPDEYNWRSLATHAIPADVYGTLQSSLQNLPK